MVFRASQRTLPMLHRLCPSHTCREDIQDSGIFPHNWPVPKISSTDEARQAVEDLTEALNNPYPASPFAVGDEQPQAIKNLQEILATSVTTSAPTPSTPIPNTALYPKVEQSPIPTTALSPRMPIIEPVVPQWSPQFQNTPRYALSTQTLTAHESCSKSEAKKFIYPMTGISQEYK